MPLPPILFDLPPLYTTPWSAPHSMGITAALRTRGWEETPVGSVIAEAMHIRGIDENHLAIEVRGRTLVAHRPECIGGGRPVVLDAHEPPKDPEPIIRLIEMCTANVARETLMRRSGWTPGAPLVPWMLMTTPIAESLLNAAGTDPFRIWSGFRSDIDVVSLPGRRDDETLTYDVNRKSKGKKDGAIGATGVQIFRSLCTTPGYEPDLRAFAEHRPYTVDAVADRIAMSRGAIGPAVNRLIEHGFVDRRRNGRQFDIRLAIPSVALTELGERWLAEDAGANTYAGEIHPAFGARILAVWPRGTAAAPRPE